jgi:hypothetical protein
VWALGSRQEVDGAGLFACHVELKWAWFSAALGQPFVCDLLLFFGGSKKTVFSFSHNEKILLRCIKI